MQRMSMRRFAAALAAAGVATAVGIGLTQSQSGTAPNPDEIVSRAPSDAEVARAFAGSPPPIAALHRRAGRLIPGGRDELRRQLEALRGHPVVVNVWGSWCGPCRLELPAFQQQAVRFGREVAFLGVNARD